MESEAALEKFSKFAVGVEFAGFKVHDVSLALDERLDGEPVTRVLMLVDDPDGETWDLDAVVELRRVLARRATELGLPRVSVSLIPESESDSVEAFAN